MKTTVQTLILVAILLLVTAIPAWAGQGVGNSPYTADLLVSGLNTGELDPGQEYWYAYSRLDLGDPAYNSVILSLNFEAEGRAIASRVNFQVFDFSQVEAWLKDRSGPIASQGLGTPASADFDVNTGERFWAGPIRTNEVYYVRVFNLSPSPVQFRLTALGQKSDNLEGFTAANTTKGESAVIPAAVNLGGQTETATPIEPDNLTTAAPSTSRTSIAADLPVQPTTDSPASTSWLLAAQAINGLPPNEAAAWLMSAAMLGWLPTGNGASAAVPKDPNEDVAAVAGGEGGGDGVGETEAAVPVDPSKGENIYPNQPARLFMGENTGRLSPKSQQWYTFTAGNVEHKKIENFSLTMFFTPGEPNLSRDVTFELFTADQYPIWERGTPDQMEHFGAGSWVSRDGDYNTGERLWHGTVVDGGIYYIKLTNETNKWIDYHLITGDIYNIEMGPPLVNKQPPVVETEPTGKDIGSPLPISKGTKTGRLLAGEDLWFSFEHKDFQSDDFQFNSYYIELRHKPGDGYVANQVNFEIYPFQDQHIWRRGDTDQIKPLGAGSDFGREKSTNTHIWVWDGHFVSNTIYFIRVRNDSIVDIDYELLIRRK